MVYPHNGKHIFDTGQSFAFGETALKKRDVLYLILLVLILNMAITGIFSGIEEPAPIDDQMLSQQDENVIDVDKEISINARSACVIDFETGTILYEKSAYKKRPMASTTKVMTAILAIESIPLDANVKISGKAANMGGSVMGIKEGSTVSMKDLLYGLLLCSGNDAAVAIAEHISGSTEAFAELMNQKANEIGAYETSFSNPHGLDAENHYTTAYDLAKITRYALHLTTFNQIISTREYVYQGRTFRNTNEMLGAYDGADGVKTGFTGLAGRCLVTSATRNGIRLISVVLFCDTKNLRTLSSKTILDYTFSHFSYVKLLDKGSVVGKVPIRRSKNGPELFVSVPENLKAIMDYQNRDTLYTRVSLPNQLEAPVKKGAIVGTVSVFKGDEIIAETSLIAANHADRKGLSDYVQEVLSAWTGIMR